MSNYRSLGTCPWSGNLATDIQYLSCQGQGTGDGFRQEGGAQDERDQLEEKTSNKPPGCIYALKGLEYVANEIVSKAESLDKRLAQFEAWMEGERKGSAMQPRCESWHHPVKDIDDQDRNPYPQEGQDDEMGLHEDDERKYDFVDGKHGSNTKH